MEVDFSYNKQIANMNQVKQCRHGLLALLMLVCCWTASFAQADCSGVTITGGGGSITCSGLTAPITMVQIFNSSWATVENCAGNCQGVTHITSGLSAGQYYVKVTFFTAGWGQICVKELYVTCTSGGGCSNVTSGGTIGGAQTICPGSTPTLLTNATSPSGGSGTLEYMWLSSTSGCPTNGTQAIAGATGATYQPGPLSQTTNYIRCSRRAGCSDANSWNYGETPCVTVTVSTSACPPVCGAIRTISNNVEGQSCTAGATYGMWLNDVYPGLGNSGRYYQFQNATFTENADGTATLTGLAVNNANSNVKWMVNVTFCGRTFTAPANSPKSGCYSVSGNGYYYYTSTCGTLTGQGAAAGGLINISRTGPAFQVGVGANLNEANSFGASGWMATSVVSHPAGVTLNGAGGGDLNFNLSGSATSSS